MKYKKIFVVVIDSMGIGEAPDAAAFGDTGCDTLGHIDEHMSEFKIPNLVRLGLSDLHPLGHAPDCDHADGYRCRLFEAGSGKDTLTGHWEMMGIRSDVPFVSFTDTGFPPELIAELEKRTGHKIIGNKAASGTQILDELGEEEIATGHMIVYTSADSVMQICGNEETFGLSELYRCCEIARDLTMKKEWRVGRIIARPYTGKKKGEFVRTANRRDYSLEPPIPMALDAMKDAGKDVIGIGKIHDIFSGRGLTKWLHSDSSVEGMDQTIEFLGEDFEGLCFTNLVDFDAKWGHRRDPLGYGAEIERFDEKLGIFLGKMTDSDLIMVTADHGNDPTFKGTDHTREIVPLLMYSPSMKKAGRLPDQDTFAVIGATCADNFGVKMPAGTVGTSLLGELK